MDKEGGFENFGFLSVEIRLYKYIYAKIITSSFGLWRSGWFPSKKVRFIANIMPRDNRDFCWRTLEFAVILTSEKVPSFLLTLQHSLSQQVSQGTSGRQAPTPL